MSKCHKCGVRERRYAGASCKECHNEYQKAYYKKHPHSIDASRRRRSKAIRELVIRAKDAPCMDCGVKYPFYIMELDHCRGEKKFILAVAASKYRSLDSVSREIEKCDLVCANCHRERTFSRQALSRSVKATHPALNGKSPRSIRGGSTTSI